MEFIRHYYRLKYLNIFKGWKSIIAGSNIAKLSIGGIYKPSLQDEILKNAQEVEFINQYYRQK